MKKQLEKAKGITLIALVITIIVLLILAGVSIATLTGEGGILGKATTAKIETEKAKLEEQIKIAIMNARMNDGLTLDLEELEKGLKEFGITTEEITKQEEGKLPWEIRHEGYIVKIDEQGKFEFLSGITLDKTTIQALPETTIEIQATKTEDVREEIKWSLVDTVGEVTENGEKIKLVGQGDRATVTIGANATAGNKITITAKSGTHEAKCEIVVIQKVTGITAKNMEVSQGKTATIEIETMPKENVETLSYAYQITAGADKVEIDGNSGEVVGKEIGTATIKITATREDGTVVGTATCTVEVKENIPTVSMEDAKKVNVFDAKTGVIDSYGNMIKVPEGFKIASDSATDVTGGVVIEDVNHGATAGSQFVWIPVGTVYTNVDKTTSKTIALNRYDFDNSGNQTPQGEKQIVNCQELKVSNKGNTVSKDIDVFKTSATTNGGYYIGRYEARKASSGKVTVKPNDYVYNYVAQPQAATLARGMYGVDKKFTSDLINSYAWDTAIVFLQTFDNRTNRTTKYSRQKTLNASLAPTGTNNLTDTTNQDKICNIWDMASNCLEWTTETVVVSGASCASRGGYFSVDYYYAGSRFKRRNEFRTYFGFF